MGGLLQGSTPWALLLMLSFLSAVRFILFSRRETNMKQTNNRLYLPMLAMLDTIFTVGAAYAARTADLPI